MGNQQEEAAAYDKIIQDGIKREAAAIAAADAAAKKAADDAAKAQGQSSMTAGGTAVGWPDNEVQPAPSKLDQLAGAAGVGKAGDAAFAKKLLDSGQPRAGSTPPAAQADGAKDRATGQLGARGATPAFER